MLKICYFVIEIQAPVPASVQNIIGTACKDVPGSYNDTTIYVYSRGDGKCNRIEEDDIETHDVRMANQIVFVFQVRNIHTHTHIRNFNGYALKYGDSNNVGVTNCGQTNSF